MSQFVNIFDKGIRRTIAIMHRFCCTSKFSFYYDLYFI